MFDKNAICSTRVPLIDGALEIQLKLQYHRSQAFKALPEHTAFVAAMEVTMHGLEISSTYRNLPQERKSLGYIGGPMALNLAMRFITQAECFHAITAGTCR